MHYLKKMYLYNIKYIGFKRQFLQFLKTLVNIGRYTSTIYIVYIKLFHSQECFLDSQFNENNE